jgi:hypothetical protein
MILTAAAISVVAIAAAFAIAPSGEIRTEIAIDAPPAKVWSILTDAAAYAEWNPFIVEMKGEIVQGGTIENTMQPGNGSRIVFKPTVLTVDPERELRWLGRLFVPRIFDGEHYFLLEETATGTRLLHGERFRGVLLWAMSTDGFRDDFKRMNEALKARAENNGIATD